MNILAIAEKRFAPSEKPLAPAHIPPASCQEVQGTNNPVFPCLTCDSHYLGWCREVPGKSFFNLKFLKLCPVRLPEDFPSQARRWNCVGCIRLDRDPGIYWCAGEPGRFRNIARMQACPKTIN
jgi:hypothetical protein